MTEMRLCLCFDAQSAQNMLYGRRCAKRSPCVSQVMWLPATVQRHAHQSKWQLQIACGFECAEKNKRFHEPGGGPQILCPKTLLSRRKKKKLLHWIAPWAKRLKMKTINWANNVFACLRLPGPARRPSSSALLWSGRLPGTSSHLREEGWGGRYTWNHFLPWVWI